jgi:hypothetical protein
MEKGFGLKGSSAPGIEHYLSSGGLTTCPKVTHASMDWKLGFKPDSAGGHLACLLARQVGSLPVGIGSEAYLPRRRARISALVISEQSPFDSLRELRVNSAQSTNLLVLLTSAKLSAHNETSIAARNHHDRQNRSPKIRADAVPSLSSFAENTSLSKRARSRHRSGRPAAAGKQIA